MNSWKDCAQKRLLVCEALGPLEEEPIVNVSLKPDDTMGDESDSGEKGESEANGVETSTEEAPETITARSPQEVFLRSHDEASSLKRGIARLEQLLDAYTEAAPSSSSSPDPPASSGVDGEEDDGGGDAVLESTTRGEGEKSLDLSSALGPSWQPSSTPFSSSLPRADDDAQRAGALAAELSGSFQQQQQQRGRKVGQVMPPPPPRLVLVLPDAGSSWSDSW